MQLSIPLKKPDGSPALPGFRLKRLEMFNWGTFNGKVERMLPDCRWTLISGKNGSGKSTAADALRTLLVPPAKLSYNDASLDQKTKHAKKDRTKKTYIRGAYKSSSQEDSITAVTNFHRPEGQQSILLAVFANEHTSNEVTLAQIHWMNNDEYDQRYLIARQDRNIREHLTQLGTGRDFHRKLEINGFEPFKSFPAYETKFRSLLGIKGQGALEVFNQVIGVKEVDNLNYFIRRFLLEQSDTPQYIAEHLKPHFSQLSGCWAAIERAEAQLAQLRPIAEKYQKLDAAEEMKEGFEHLKTFVPFYYAQKELGMRIVQEERLDALLAKRNAEVADLQKALQADTDQQESLRRAIQSDKVGERLEDIEKEIKEALKVRDAKLRALEAVKANLTTLNQPTALSTEEQFTAMRRKLLTDKGTIEGNLAAQEQKRIENGVTKQDLERQRSQVAREAQSVRDARVLIPHHLLEMREAICEGTGISIADLPFAGELIEVKSEHREWTGAIERLLHGFGISLLVPESRYMMVASFINKTNLRGCLDFHKVPAAVPAFRPDILHDTRRVPARLGFKSDSPLIHWVQGEIVHRFDHICCSSIQQLNDVEFGITVEGLIRNRNHHRKDDRSRIDDRSQYVLGWNTQAKLAALMTEVEDLTDRLKDLDKKIRQMDEQIAATRGKIDALKEVLKVENFADINPTEELEALERLHREQEQLTASSDKVRGLKAELVKTKDRISAREQEISELNQVIGGIKSQRVENQKEAAKLQETIKATPEGMDEAASGIEAVQEGKTVTVDNVDEVRASVETKIQNRINAQTGNITNAKNFLLPAMTTFLAAYPEETKGLQANVEQYGEEFVKLLALIEKERLPEFKDRFFSLLNRNLIMNLGTFSTKLEEDEKNIRDRIESVNASLRKIEFTPGTHARVIVAPAKSDEIKSFKAELRACLSGGIQPGEAELKRIYDQIQTLITHFDKEPEWAARVTDVRNWLDYGVKRLADADGKEVEYYAGSGGKSGGQKSFLAFMILGAAIMSQYGMTGNGNDYDCFRVIVVDEVFGKTDEEFSQRVLELFKKLDLQLIIVNPFDAKTRIVEDYVHSYHLVTERDNLSTMKRASRVDYEDARDK